MDDKVPYVAFNIANYRKSVNMIFLYMRKRICSGVLHH